MHPRDAWLKILIGSSTTEAGVFYLFKNWQNIDNLLFRTEKKKKTIVYIWR